METNLLILTDRRVYHLYAQSFQSLFLPAVGWNYAK